jgi:hypothetical protein
MNLRSNISKITVAGLTVAILAGYVPTMAYAVTSTEGRSSVVKQSPFCAQLPSKVTQITTNMANNKAKVPKAQINRTQKITSDRNKVDQEIAADRAKWDQDRQNNYTKLEAKATIDAQKNAVKTYESTITSAIATRRAAYDAARTTYRDAVDVAISSMQSQVDSQILTFNNAVNAAISAAETSCSADASNRTAIRTQFISDMGTARQNYQSDRKSDDNLGSTIKQLAQDRNASFKAADDVFKTTAESARGTLKAAFGSDSI